MSNGVQGSQDTGHDFHKKLLRPGHYCHHCGESLWGSAAACRCCKFVAHERCSEGAVTPCSRVAINYIANPVAHTWSLQQKFKKRFCNVCRRKMDDRLGVRCVVCKYYAHKRCLPTSLPMCKRSAYYDAFVTPDEHSQTQHQWMEGNLKAVDKCAVCAAACGGADVLSGQRCLWCLSTVHSSCAASMDARCQPPAALRRLILPPYAVYRPDMPGTEQPLAHAESLHDAITSQQLAEHMLGFRLHEAGDGDTVSIAESLASDIMSQSSSMVSLRVYDSSVDRYKKILVPADANPEEMLAASQQEFNIAPEDAGQFCLALETAARTYEPVEKLAGGLDPSDKLVFRSTEHHMSHLRVHWSGGGRNELAQCAVNVSPVTTAEEVVGMAIDALGLVVTADERRRADYVLAEMNMFDGLAERVLGGHEKPWKVMRDFAKVSVQQLQMVRLYLRNVKMDVPCTLYVGNLPLGWDEARLVDSLKQALGTLATDELVFGPAFPQFGAVFLFSRHEEAARQACAMLSTAILVDAKRPTVYLVPTVQEEVIPDSSSPLLVFVNERSGGGQGAELLTQMIRLLNPYQVFNLSHGGPLPGLFAFRQLKSFRVLVAGGDGTVGWVLSQMDAMRPLFKNPGASVAVIPLGTGNDLARVLRWGAGFGGESAMSILEVMEDSLIVPLDRWNVDFDGGEFGSATSPRNFEGSPSADAAQSFVMNNYLGVGVEAEIALKFHLAREENPEKFSSRLHNKGVYLKMSIGKMMQRGGGEMSRDLSKVMVLDVDKERIKIPGGVEGIIILNIKSWMAGCDGWGAEKDDKFKAPAMNDGLLEVIGVQGVMHLGQIQGGLRGGFRLAQGSDISFRISCPTPVEIDGEPFMQPAGQCRVVQGNTVQMMRRHKRPVHINPPPSIGT